MSSQHVFCKETKVTHIPKLFITLKVKRIVSRIIMKTRSLIIAALAAFAAVSCGPKVSDKTAITGDLGADASDKVEITIKEAGVEMSVPVTNGKFTAEVPACKTSVARLKTGKIIGSFISDGTPLTITINEDKTLNVVSKYPKVSVQSRYNDFQKAMTDLQALYQPKIEAAASEEVQDKIYDSYQNDVRNLCLTTLDGNKDNILAISSLDNLQYLVDTRQLDSILSVVDPSLSGASLVKNLTKSVSAKKMTAEGQKFTDFSVNGKKLSDYVGNGKYILVDFWASWCGPCKAEVPNLKEVYSKYAGKEFDILGVAVWDKEKATEKAIKDLALPWNQIINAQSIPTDLYGIDGIPHIILFGPDGTIVKRNLRGADIEAEVAKYVKPVK